MAVTWNSKLYMDLIDIYQAEMKKNQKVNGAYLFGVLNQTRSEVFHKSSVVRHWSNLRNLAQKIAEMDAGLPLSEYQDVATKVVKTGLMSFSEDQIARLREFGASILEKDMINRPKLPFHKKQAIAEKAVMDSDRKRVDPRIERAIWRMTNASMSGPLSEIVREKLDVAINSVITPRIVTKIVNHMADQVCYIFQNELKNYNHDAKRQKIDESEPDDEDDKEEEEEEEIDSDND